MAEDSQMQLETGLAARIRRLASFPILHGFAVGFTFLVIACAALVSIFMIGDRAVRATLHDHLATMAQAAAVQIDPARHATFTDASLQNGPAYLEVVEPLRELVAALPSLHGLYTIRDTPEGLRFVLDTKFPGTPVGDSVDSQLTMMGLVPGEGRAMRRALGSGKIAFSCGPYVDPWGSFVSAYLPIRNESGQIECLMGVDVDAADYIARRDVMRSALHVGCLVALAGAVVVGGFSFWMQRLRRMTAVVLEESRERFRAMSDAVPIMVWTSDADARITDVNQRWLDFTGRTMEEEVGAGWLDGVHSDDRAHADAAFRGAYEAGDVYSCEYRLRRADGVYRWIQDLGYPRRDVRGRLIGFVGGALDISDRKHAELTLSLSEQRLRTIIDTAIDAVITMDSHGRITEWNRQAERTFGWAASEALGRELSDLIIPPAYREAHQNGMRRFLAGGESAIMGRRVEVPALRRDGELIQVELSIGLVTGAGDVSFSAFLRDVTEARRAEDVARICRADADVHLNVSTILQDASPIEDRLQRAMRAIADMESVLPGQWLFLCDGEGRPDDGVLYEGDSDAGARSNSVSPGQPVRDPALRALVVDALRSGRMRCGEGSTGSLCAIPMCHADRDIGALVLAMRSADAPDDYRFDAIGRIAEAIAIAILRDRSEREIAAQRERAEVAGRAKSAFLANMSHEIRTPMTAILGFTDMLSELDDGGPEGSRTRREIIMTIRRNGEHLLGIINDILDLSKIEAGKVRVDLAPVDPSEVVGEVMDLFRGAESAKSLSLNCRVDPAVPPRIVTDPLRFRQILVNLVGNAVKFTSEGSVDLDVDWNPAGMLRACVRDTGVGMCDEQVGRLFQPFVQGDETTTRQFGGTGLGLVIARRLARLLGGDIVVESAPGAGSTFTLTIAAQEVHGAFLQRDAGAAPKAAAITGRPLAGRRILVAEDSPDNQRLITFMLERAGAVVDLAPNGMVAIERVQEAGEASYDLVLMDMQMPVMDGYTAARKLQDLHCTVPVIAVTAHAMNEDRMRCEAAGCSDYITKPINRIDLLGTCQRWLAPVASAES